MESAPNSHPGVPPDEYHTLGPRTFYVFLVDWMGGTFIFLALAVALYILNAQPFLAEKSFAPVAPYVIIAAHACLGLFLVVLAITILAVWLTYKNYQYCLSEDSLKIRRGVFSKEEIAIPYRQIQDVDIRRSFSFQLMGLSRIMILTAGQDQEKEDPHDDDSEGILPAIDRDLAEWLQGELLRRANVQKVTEEGK
ncbi:MAG TPA: PH domain-containing protein [Candidatus Paceibacterota bacterium]|nr:PH domain-containing protein [Candidatus Paceibacterota bacterium]